MSVSQKPVFSGEFPPRKDGLHAHIAATRRYLNEEQLDEAFERVRDLYDLKEQVWPDEVNAIVEEILLQPKTGWKLISIKTSLGTNIIPAATVVVNDPRGKRVVSESGGYSTTDAICSAIQQATGIRAFLKDLWYSNVSAGMNALGQVTMTVEYHSTEVHSKACSVDILEAIAKAFLTAVNIIVDRANQRL